MHLFQEKAPKIDKEAVRRFIRSGLWENNPGSEELTSSNISKILPPASKRARLDDGQERLLITN